MIEIIFLVITWVMIWISLAINACLVLSYKKMDERLWALEAAHPSVTGTRIPTGSTVADDPSLP